MNYRRATNIGGKHMYYSSLMKSEDDLEEFYRFLLQRAQESEAVGCRDIGRTYREYADNVVGEMNRLKSNHRTH